MPAPHAAPVYRRSPIERGCGDPLVDLLDADPVLRRYAVDGAVLDGAGLYALRERLLEDSHAPVRLAAGERLARAAASSFSEGRPTRAELVRWLFTALKDAAPSVREVACRALARHAPREPGCEAALARMIGEEPIWWVRRAAARALAAVAGEAAIPALIQGLEDPFWRVRHGVVQALDLIVTRSSKDEAERERLRERVLAAGPGLSEVARAALAYLASGWPEGEDEGPEVLGIIRDPGAGLELGDADPAVVTARLQAADEVEPAALVPLLAESHEALRDEAARRLAKLDDPSCLAPALAWLEDPRVPNAPAATRRLLRRLGGRARGLAERALAAGRPGGVIWAAGWVAEHPAEDLHRALFGYVEHPRVAVRVAVLRAIGRLLTRERGQDEALRALLLDGLGDPACEVRDAAAEGLLDARAGEGLLDRLAAERDPSLGGGLELSPSVRARVLGTLADPKLCEAALDDPAAEIRAAALARLAVTESLDPSARARALGDPDPRVRLAALDLPAAVAVFQAGEERDPTVRRVAARLLVSGRSQLEPALASVILARLRGAEDPWLRARAADFVDPEQLDADALAGLLRATRDGAAMVRLAASARLDRVPELDSRLEAIVSATETGEPELRLAAWSRLAGALAADPEQARARLEQAAAGEGDEQVREHLRALALMFGAEPPPAPRVELVERAPVVAPTPAAVARRALGRSGIELAPLVVSGAFSLTPSSLAFAAERGVDTYFWEPRYINSTRFLRQPQRRELQVVAGSFHADRRGLTHDLETARRRLRRDHIDLFLLFWVRSPARLGAEALASLREFVERGWIRSYGFSTHDRAIACEAIAGGDWPVVMTRHSAAHTGAEQELLPAAAAASVGVLGFSALCYGRMLRPSAVFERGPAAIDCYRYSLAQPAVAACVSAPRSHRELAHNLGLLDASPRSDEVASGVELSDDRREALRAHGAEVYADNKRFDRLLRRGGTAPLREAILELFERASEPEQDGPSGDAGARAWR